MDLAAPDQILQDQDRQLTEDALPRRFANCCKEIGKFLFVILMGRDPNNFIGGLIG